MIKTTLLPFLAASLLSMGCQQAPPGDSASNGSSSTTPDPAVAVEYEPAFPTEVSSEGLSTEDVAQQATAHPHDGGEEHAHDGESDHEEDGTHDDHDH